MKSIVALSLAAFAAAANAASISGVAASVGSDGTVTVTYSLDEDAVVTADFRENGTSIGGTNQWSLSGDVFKLVPAGPGVITWNAKKDVPERLFSALTVELKAWAESDAPDYLIADLMAGSTCRLRYYPSVDFIPGGIVEDEAYRMYYLPFRKIRAKGVTWTMGTETEKGRSGANEEAHEVTLGSNYYIGVFELTHAQCAACGISVGGADSNNKAYNWRLIPQHRWTWNSFRGALPPAAPAASSSFGKIKDRTGLLVDFPLESQWEYAARGGYGEGTWGDGSDILSATSDRNLNNLASYKNHVNSITNTGSFSPNGYGLYDMHGNFNEYCQDWFQPNIAGLNGALCVDAADSSKRADGCAGTNRVVRGGYYGQAASSCRASYRAGQGPGSTKTETSCRLMTYANLGEESEPASAVLAEPFALDTRSGEPASAVTDAAVNLHSRRSVLSDAFAVDMLKVAGMLLLLR